MSAGRQGGDGGSVGGLIDCAVVQVFGSETTAGERGSELHYHPPPEPERRGSWFKVSFNDLVLIWVIFTKSWFQKLFS